MLKAYCCNSTLFAEVENNINIFYSKLFVGIWKIYSAIKQHRIKIKHIVTFTNFLLPRQHKSICDSRSLFTDRNDSYETLNIY